MIYLIGGPPRCGKTTVARRLARLTGASVLTVDDLESVIYHYLPDEERARAMPRMLEYGNNARYAAHTIDEIIAILRQCARAVWPAIQILIHFSLEQGQDVILDGYQIEPGLLAELTPPDEAPEAGGRKLSAYQAAMVARGSVYALAHAGDARIRTAFLCREDVADILASLTRGEDPNDWIVCQENKPETLQRIATMIGRYSGYVRAEAQAIGAAAFAMDHDFPGQVERVVEFLARG